MSAQEQELMRLMVAYQGGDLGAFEQLYAALVDDVRRYFSRSARDRRALNDLVQDTFLEMHRSLRTYLPELPVRPWVFGIARNILGRSRRSAWHWAARSSTQSATEEDLAAPVNDTRAIDFLDIENALACLPAGYRDSWLLHHVLGWSFSAIAAHLGITVVAAKLRSSRATRALRAALRGSEQDK